MKKIVLSIAGVMAVAAFAPEASALPVFARQTGMACSACHFQHFPMLNGFGRAFKSAGYTMMGAQEKVEGEALSIPSTLNLAMLTSMGYVKTNQTADTTGATKNNGNGTWGVPGVGGGGGVNEASLFIGGRVSEFAGFLSEVTLGGASAALDSAKMPMLFPVGDYRIGAIPFATNAQGASYGLETLNTGANAVHMQSNSVGPNGEFAGAMSAQQYMGTGGNAVGVAFAGTSDMGFVNITKFQQTGIAAGATGSLGSTYARIAATFDMAGWDSGVGIQSWSGASLFATPATPAVSGVTAGVAAAAATNLQVTKATAIDGQMQGELGGMPVGFYASYATAPGSAAGAMVNTYNGGTLTRSSFNINAELGFIPGVATVGAAVRQAKSGIADAAGNNLTDNAIMLTGTYKLQQNMLARLSYVSQSGSMWSQAYPAVGGPLGALNAGAAGTVAQVVGSKTTMLNMYVLF